MVAAALVFAACSSSRTTPTATAPKSESLEQAVTNTISATNYSEILSQDSSQGQQTDHLTYQAPDRLGGYVQSD